ncbi:MAG: HlyD family efflux transporter periplasmic adaptor subunit [Planctomycetes bacterium]|nr:HlyD family efflux transporter periplasmic adaptor subunit [Planctomycetota bacterium]
MEAWKEQEIGFEVKGRVQWTIEEGEKVEGRTYDQEGNALTEGTVLARLDTTRYELAISSAEAKLAAIRAQADAAQIEIEQVLRERLKAAEAEQTRAQMDFKRAVALLRQKAGSAQDADKAKADFETQQARVDGVKARTIAKRAELKSLEADAREAEQAVKEAKVDLADCSLFSPFNGQVSKVYVIPGAYVSPGRPAITVVVMDPIKVDVAVSATVEGTIAIGDAVRVFPPGRDEPVLGWVWNKETTADSATRTFKVTIMVRNHKVTIGRSPTDEEKKLPRIKDMVTTQRLDVADPKSPLLVNTKALYKDGEGYYYVWKVENLRFNQVNEETTPVLTIKRVRVKLGKHRLALLGHFFQEVVGTDTIRMRKDLLAVGVPDGVKDGGKVFLTREQWLLRPGDVVGVLLSGKGPGEGFYVPMRAIIAHGQGKGEVCVVQDDKVRKVPVKLGESIGDLFRIEAVDADGEALLKDGAQIISKDIHFLVSGEAVRVSKTERLAQ